MPVKPGGRETRFDGAPPFAAGGQKFRFANYYLAGPLYFIRPDRRRRITSASCCPINQRIRKRHPAVADGIYLSPLPTRFLRELKDIPPCLPVNVVDGRPLPPRRDFPSLRFFFLSLLYITSTRNRYYAVSEKNYIHATKSRTICPRTLDALSGSEHRVQSILYSKQPESRGNPVKFVLDTDNFLISHVVNV